MATPAQRTNTWTLDQWYDQSVAGTTGGYVGENKFYAWGSQQMGELGDNSITSRQEPVQIPGNWAIAILGWTGSQGVKTDGTLWSWGYGRYGGLGNNTAGPDGGHPAVPGMNYALSSPVQLPGTDWSSDPRKNAKTQSASTASGANIKTDGTLWIWGSGYNGEMGQNNRTQYSSPVQLPGTTWKSVSSNYTTFGATKTDGTLWAWGPNPYGSSGFNEPAPYKVSSPTQIGTDTDWNNMAGGDQAIRMCTKTDGTLWIWGRNDNYGGLGLNNVINYSSPMQLPGTTWGPGTNITGHGRYLIGWVKTDGTLWSWGDGADGGLGQNTPHTTDVSSPTQVGTDTDWASVSWNYQSMAAIKTDGTLWTWGDGARSGRADGIGRSSPTQVGSSTSWDQVHGGMTATFAQQII